MSYQKIALKAVTNGSLVTLARIALWKITIITEKLPAQAKKIQSRTSL
jgi:hypothetical protein